MPIFSSPYPEDHFYYPAYTSGNWTTFGNYMALALATNASCYFNFQVPQTVGTVLNCDLFAICSSTATYNYNANSNSAPAGSAYTTFAASLATTASAQTLNNLSSVSLSSLIPATLAAGQNIGIKFTSNTSFWFVTGLRVRWQ